MKRNKNKIYMYIDFNTLGKIFLKMFFISIQMNIITVVIVGKKLIKLYVLYYFYLIILKFVCFLLLNNTHHLYSKMFQYIVYWYLNSNGNVCYLYTKRKLKNTKILIDLSDTIKTSL